MILIVFLSFFFVFGQGDDELAEYNEDKLDTLFQPSIVSAVIVLTDQYKNKNMDKTPKEKLTTNKKDLINEQNPFYDCEEALEETSSDAIGSYYIKLPGFENLGNFKVGCEPDPGGGPAWTRIQHHSEGGVINFNGDWRTYREGFGFPTGDFFLGLTYIHALTHSQPHELWIQLENSEGNEYHAYYNLFAIGDENQDFPLLVLGKHSGNISDALRNHVGQKFSTSDRDNDSDKKKNCAEQFLGGWWFYNCADSDDFSNLNGNFIESKNKGMGIRWDKYSSRAEFRNSSMYIRPVSDDLN